MSEKIYILQDYKEMCMYMNIVSAMYYNYEKDKIQTIAKCLIERNSRNLFPRK